MTDTDSYFHDADAPFIPKLVDIEYWKAQDDNLSKQSYFSQFGWDALEYDSQAYEYIHSRWTVLTQRFNQRYYNRMIGAESMERWQNRLQNKFDEVADKYERAYTLYDQYMDALYEGVITGEKETITGTTQASGSDTVTSAGTDKDWDTPDSAVNQSASYADRVRSTSNNGSTTYGKLDTVSSARQKILTGDVVGDLNNSIESWKDIDTQFIKEFESLFLNIFWY